MVKTYWPEADPVTFEIEGSGKKEEKPLGPVQKKVTPLPLAKRFRADPLQTGELLEAVGPVRDGSFISIKPSQSLSRPSQISGAPG